MRCDCLFAILYIGVCVCVRIKFKYHLTCITSHFATYIVVLTPNLLILGRERKSGTDRRFRIPRNYGKS